MILLRKTYQFVLYALFILSGGFSLTNTRPELPNRKTIEKLPPDGGPRYNRLIFEQSPYLLQHAANPVDWYPWGKEAFEAARKEDKPIFLSIGYSTCHWCHVMEHESFTDAEVAELLNKWFICIKVDREERPEIDHIYMSVCQAMTGHGGWPLTVLLTPDLKPFFAGTYFPRDSYMNRIGMMDLLPRLHDTWTSKRYRVEQSANQILDAVFKKDAGSQELLDEEVFERAFEGFQKSFDIPNGGFGQAPKFPTPHQYRFLLRYAKRKENKQALNMVTSTLRKMRQGGIFDQLGLGFHRYSVDAEWLVPHFEKMLYDQALLAMLYLETYQVTTDAFFKHTAEEIFEYVMRDLTHPEGGFLSAEDADSEGVEGKFYVWTDSEIKALTSPEDGQFIADIFQIKPEGNYREESTHQTNGTNILHMAQSYAELAQKYNMQDEPFAKRVQTIRKTLFLARKKRVHPFKDDKTLADWNGLMIAALARGYRVTGNETYLKAAQKAAAFVWNNMRNQEGGLLRRYRKGQAGLQAVLEDYAFMIYGYIELYQATFKLDTLEKAIELMNYSIDLFWDPKEGGFYQSQKQPDLIVRLKEYYDGAIPSGNSMQIDNLLKLGHLTGNRDYLSKGRATLASFAQQIKAYPAGYSQALCALDFELGPTREVVFSLATENAEWIEIKQALGRQFHPRSVFLLRTEKNRENLARLSPFSQFQVAVDNQLTLYCCEGFSCRAPQTDARLFLEALR
ncbi:MAG: thioredoxin domain-containing protein [Acidobacteria bacterium]|nr:MAG: thioredoxin domain-containing protein [Acidobacteriota bacterium]